ncbi:MAG: TraB/GumN family protein [Kiloniellaceae bacterium]
MALLLLSACATQEPPPPPQRVEVPHGEGRIWQVEGEDIERSFVFGTFHISDPRVLAIPAAAEKAFAGASIAAFEYDYGPKDHPVPPIDRERFKLEEGTTLRGVIGARAFGKLSSVLQGVGYWKPRNDLKPWIVWDWFGGSRGIFYTNDDESDPDAEVLDGWLQQRAYDEDKRVVGLETVEEGFVKYDTIPLEQQAALLTTMLDNYHRHRAGAPVVQHYLDGDLAMLMAYWNEAVSWYPPEVGEMIDWRILTNRNHIMVERMLPLMREGSTFVAVGAGHLPGEEGILRLLEQEGYTVTRLH